MKQKENTGNCRAKPKKRNALSKMILPPLPDGVPDFPKVIMKRGVHFTRTRQLYSQIAYGLVAYGDLHQAIDSMLIAQAAVSYKIWEDCVATALDPKKRILKEAKTHATRDPITKKMPTTLKEHPDMETMRKAESAYIAAIDKLGLTVIKRVGIINTLSLYESIHGNSKGAAADPFAKFFIGDQIETAEFYK